MTTLAVNTARNTILGNVNAYPVIASDIIFAGSAIGLVDATGHARPLESTDRFGGFCRKKADNSGGSAADINVEAYIRGVIILSVSGAVITDLGQPVYATDDNVFVFSPVGGVFIGKVIRFVSAGVVEVAYDALNGVDPYGGWTWEKYSTSDTATILDTGVGFWVDTDGLTLTLLTYAAATAIQILVVNAGAFGTIEVKVDPAGADKIAGPVDTGADGGIATNTKATARRGDYLELHSGGDDGYIVRTKKGIWTIA